MNVASLPVILYVLPVFMLLAFGADRIWKKVCCGLIAVALLICLFASQSRAGFFGVIASLILIPVLFLKNWEK